MFLNRIKTMEDRKKNILPLIGIFISALIVQTTSIISIVLPGIKEAFPEVSLNRIQLIATIPNIVMIASQLLTGPVSLKVSKKTIMLTACTISFAGGMMFALFGPSASGIGILLIASALIGVGNGAFVIALQSTIIDLYSGEKKGQVLGALTFFASLGTMVLLALSGFLAKTRWSNAYYVFLLHILVFAMILIFIPYSRPALSGKAEGKGEKRSIGHVSAALILYFVTYALFYVSKYTHTLNYGLLVTSSGMGDTVNVGIVGSVGTFAAMLGSLSTVYVQKYLKKYSMILSILLTAVGMIVMYTAGTILAVYISAAILGFSGANLSTAVSVLMTDISSKALAPMVFAVSGIFTNVGVMLSPVVINSMSEALFGGTYKGNYAAGALFLTVPLVLSLILLPVTRKESARIKALDAEEQII